MNKPLIFLTSVILGLGASKYANASNLNNKKHQDLTKQSHQNTLDPFDIDPFFQPNNEIFQEMNKMQEAMAHLMRNQFRKMQHNLVNRYPELHHGIANDIQIQESKNKLVYKIKLPKESDNKIDVSIKNNRLRITSNATQKIRQEKDNTKQLSYSYSSNTRSFQIPKNYNEKSMKTTLKDKNLIITFNKNT